MKPKLQGAGCAEQTLAFQGKLGDDKEGKKHRLLAHVTNPRHRKAQERHGASRARKQELRDSVGLCQRTHTGAGLKGSCWPHLCRFEHQKEKWQPWVMKQKEKKEIFSPYWHWTKKQRGRLFYLRNQPGKKKGPAKGPCAAIGTIVGRGKDDPWMLKLLSERWLETWYSPRLKRILANYTWEKVLSQWRDFGRQHGHQTNNGTKWHVPPDVMQLKVHNII